jgi:DtxR family transcriptional regulator, manganese transport regulator
MGCETAPRLNALKIPTRDCILQPRLHIKRAVTFCRLGPLWAVGGGGMTARQRGAKAASAVPELATEPVQADRFGKARSARSASMLEDYTELIADLIAANGEARTTDIARRLGVAHPTASKTIARLKREGLATARPYRGIFLTEAGVAMANSVRQRHRLVVDLLVAVGAPREAAEADAEGIEHYVSDATLRAFEAFLRGRGQS